MTDILNEKKFKQLIYFNQDKDSKIKIEINEEIGTDKVKVVIKTVRESKHGGQRCCIVHTIDTDVFDVLEVIDRIREFING